MEKIDSNENWDYIIIGGGINGLAMGALLSNDGKKVLVCGAPCQIAGLYTYLKKDYDNLITCDFICKSVNSTKVFQKYIEWLEKKYKSKAKKIKAKDKTSGWHNFSMRVDFENGKSYVADRHNDPFFIGYLNIGRQRRKA